MAAEESIYIYVPNKVAPIIFAIAFAASLALHFWQCIHYKCFQLMILHLVCCLMFTIGFALREYGAFHHSFSKPDLYTYVVSTCLIYMSPPLLELANYQILGRILYYVPYRSPIHPGRVLTTFGMLSTVVEVLNALGVAYIANPELPESTLKLGHILMKISLIAQILVITVFCFLAAIFQRRCYRSGIRSRRVSTPLITLYISTFLIFVRCIYRIVEHFGASKVSPSSSGDLEGLSPILRHEWFFYVFEASLMLVNTLLWNWRHPRRFLPERSNIYLAQDGETELKGPGWKDQRPFLVTLCDPFGWFDSNKKKERPFWENNGYTLVNSAA
ncbi:RTA1 like protein-domain-containing protein [Aspergillus minisclerotigenes]|uniref:RTA1 like protein-domain-containing protein n=1 Tax=Aspergillus minisclerotigenes TaxID=656917 RepID=A0A5N6IW94_9EURO|nr:RTA1 like protein-domain-containing protein [Aspergillus minisclerotigenes]